MAQGVPKLNDNGTGPAAQLSAEEMTTLTDMDTADESDGEGETAPFIPRSCGILPRVPSGSQALS